MNDLKLPDLYLLIAFAEPRARKAVAKAHKLPTGAVRVLNGVAFRSNIRKSTRPGDLLAANLGAKTLIRSHIAVLIKRGLLERKIMGRRVCLHITLAGLGVTSQFQRLLRETSRAFEQA